MVIELRTGQVAKLFRVAAATVSKWQNRGFFPDSYRLPPGEDDDNGDRRFPIKGIVQFAEEHKIPLDMAVMGAHLKRTVMVVPMLGFSWGGDQLLEEGWNIVNSKYTQLDEKLTSARPMVLIVPSLIPLAVLVELEWLKKDQVLPTRIIALSEDDSELDQDTLLRYGIERVVYKHRSEDVPALLKQLRTWANEEELKR